ncbi:sensor histidine kinase [Neptunicella sp. SCSIO 80796]|uniref:sensor histidine kinase n=1 Tax=Neptunicella plasticusilytica TaxID=3117012 RepID=UPI003A4E5370
MRLGSLRQLTLFSFIFAMLPLGVLLWQNQKTLTELGNIAVSQARQAVDLTRSVESMQGTAVDIERLIRQYKVLKNTELVPLIENYTHNFRFSFELSCQQTDLQQLCIAIESQLNKIVSLQREVDPRQLDDDMTRFRQLLQDFSLASAAQLDTSLDEQRNHVHQVQQEITWQTLVLVIITLMLVWAASQVVIKPVNRLEKLIRAIGNQNDELPQTEFRYPREMVELDSRLRWLAKRLAHLESIRHAMLRHASHELKTPLASIREGCSLLSDQVVGELNGQQQEVVSLLDVGAKRLTQLVEQLLDYNRLLQEASSRPDWIDIRELLNRICEQHQLSIGQNGQYFELQTTVSKLYADEKLLQRILDNLINNAIAYGKQDSAVIIQINKQDDDYLISVCNSCDEIEIPDNMQLFQPFQRGNQARNDGLSGSGLGLSIVADCARMMNGTAEIINDQKTVFCVQIILPQIQENV